MSIIDTFDSKSEAILTPDCIAKPVDGFPKTVLVTFKPEIIKILKTMATLEEISCLHVGITIPVYRFAYQNHDLGIYMTILGGSGTTALMEEILVKGAEKILIFGSCGVLDRKLTAGHFILPTAAYRDEGTSYHYLPEGDYVDIPTAKKLGDIFDALGIAYVFGRTWTTDGFYRETRNNMEARKREGCLTVEMECASVMAAGQFRSVPVYQFLYAEDSLDGLSWDARTMGRAARSDLANVLRIALETAVRL